MRGHTLPELLLVLLLVGATGASLAPSMRRWRDRAAVVGAREAVVGLFAEARMAAVERGWASVYVAAGSGVVQVRSGERVLRALAVAEAFGVEVATASSERDPDRDVEIGYDALGLGRMASQTLVFRRGDVAAELVVSGYGRVRRP